MAILAGVSVEYLIRLEQGRDRHPSTAVVSALADALRMPPSERVHLYRLVKGADPSFNCLGGAAPNREVRPAVRAVLDQLAPAPAAVINRLGEVLACTDGYVRVLGPIGLLDGGLPASIPRYLFTDPRARDAYPDWEHWADKTVANLKEGPYRSDSQRRGADRRADRHRRCGVHRPPGADSGFADANGIARMNHPDAGSLRFAYERLDLSADDDQHILVGLPADAGTAAALDGPDRPPSGRLAGRIGPDRCSRARPTISTLASA